MKTILVLLVLALTPAAGGQDVGERIALDAAVLDRVAELSERDLPRRLLERMVNDDIELMRGPRADGTYQWATWERFEASRITDSFTVKPGKEMQVLKMSGELVYRVLLDVPERRLVVRRNRPVWVERVDFEYVTTPGRNERGSLPVREWIQPGTFRPVDLPAVARQATLQVVATADPETGAANLTLALLQARIIDVAESPWAGAVAAAKTALRALGENDAGAVRLAAQRMKAALPPSAGARGLNDAGRLELETELRVIEELLDGTEAQRAGARERLRELARRLRR